jgi:hypothetical protein
MGSDCYTIALLSNVDINLTAVFVGYLKPHSRWGAVPKVTVAAIAGYFLGKISYQPKCAEMMMRLPNSRLGEALRQRRLKGGLKET